MSFRERRNIPDLGIGVGARPVHFTAIQGADPSSRATGDVDWLEVISENFFARGGATRKNLEMLKGVRPLIPHGVSLSIGGTDPFRDDYLASLKRVVGEIAPPFFSDHLCWTGVGGRESHDLLPLPYTEEAVAHVARRIGEVQDRMECTFVIENVSSYLTYQDSTMTEWQFLTEVAEAADCGILLDVNNIYVSAVNHGFDPWEFLAGVPEDRVVQIHLAGHTNKGDYLLDTHSARVVDEVWKLYSALVEKTGPVSTLLEWDDHFPPWGELVAEADRARAHRDAALGKRSEGGTK